MAKRARSYRFEMPYQVAAPLLADATTGIDRVLLRGNGERRTITLTLLDTTDERLSWAGVLLAHQVVGETGEWLLKAPDWQPWLPAEHTEPLGDDDELPEHLAAQLKPFRRRSPLGPVAGVVLERAIYSLQDETASEIGLLLDDRITVRRGGLAVARHREVRFDPGAAMTAAQRSAVVDRLNQAGAVRVDEFPPLISRLVELLHPVRVPAELPEADSIGLDEYLEWVFAARLFAITRAELQVRSGEVANTELLQAEIAEMAAIVRALADQLDPGWVAELVWHADRVGAATPRSQVDALGDDYYEVLDALAAAARAPRLRPGGPALGEEAATARETLATGATERAAELLGRVDALDVDSADADWQAARDQADELVRALNAAAPVAHKPKHRLRRVVKLLAALDAAVGTVTAPGEAELAALDPVAAFQAGRDYQAALAQVEAPRAEALADWQRLRVRLLDDWPELAKRLELAAEQPPPAIEGEH